MRRYVIAFSGDNDRLHEEALKAAVQAAEKVNKQPAYRAWIETVEYVPGSGPPTSSTQPR